MSPMRLRRFVYLTWGSCCVIREPGVNLIIIMMFAAANLSIDSSVLSSGAYFEACLFYFIFEKVRLKFFVFLENSPLNSKNCIFKI